MTAVRGRTAAVLVALAICAGPAGLAAPPPPPSAVPAPATTVLRAAAAATASEWAGAAAELPGRAHLALARGADDVRARLLPDASPAVRAWHEGLLGWRDAARTAARAAGLLTAVAHAGGPLAVLDRVLDAAALVVLAALGLHLALRPRAPRRR